MASHRNPATVLVLVVLGMPVYSVITENSRTSAFENFDDKPADVVTSSFKEFTGEEENIRDL